MHILLVHGLVIVPPIFGFAATFGIPGVYPTWPRMVANFLFALVAGDFLLYWIHRISHWPQFYWFHKLHHENTASFDIVSNYMHPVEVMIVGTAHMSVFLCMTHPMELVVVSAVRAYLDMEHHCGYSFPWSPQRWLPGFVGAHFHDYHHEVFVRTALIV